MPVELRSYEDVDLYCPACDAFGERLNRLTGEELVRTITDFAETHRACALLTVSRAFVGDVDA